MFEYLPSSIIKELKKFELKNVNEIRLRLNSRISLLINGVPKKIDYVIKDKNLISEVVFNACKRSIYSHDEDIKNGFITTESGERIGLAGEFVIMNGKVNTIRNFSSIVIRIPKHVGGFANIFFNEHYKFGSVLVFSKTGAGKTTFIRELAKLLSNNNVQNIIVIDERGEIASKDYENSNFLGENVDVLTYCNKSYGFHQAIRTLNPNFIVTDELTSETDCEGVFRAITSGINVIATVHCGDIKNIKSINFLKNLIQNNSFSNFVYIENNLGKRDVTVFDSKLNKICSY
ncbi:MAG: Flp pilus assembly complex ATPase component TadA [Clostridia bacterium]|nr:Flp pilus assembly complex ATPase component TadA [Clostridia bacterium]